MFSKKKKWFKIMNQHEIELKVIHSYARNWALEVELNKYLVYNAKSTSSQFICSMKILGGNFPLGK